MGGGLGNPVLFFTRLGDSRQGTWTFAQCGSNAAFSMFCTVLNFF